MSEPSSATPTEPEYTRADQLPWAIQLSEHLRRVVDRIGSLASWLIVPVVLITVFDVTARKLVWIQIWLVENLGRVFESTLLQELEWHFHTALFALVLGYGYIYNSHVRVDLVRETLAFRKKAWLEIIGLTFFLIPYCTIVIYFAFIYAYDSWAIGEISASQVGLSHRFIIKSILVVGLILAVVAGIAVWLQVAIVLFGPRGPPLPPDDPGMARGSRQHDRGQGADQARGRPGRAAGDCQPPPDRRERLGLSGPESTMSWEKYIKRYVWDDQRTPYLTPVARLTRIQADHELFAYTVFLAFLFVIIAVLASLGRLGGGARLVALYAFSVIVATAVLGWAKQPAAAWYLLVAPVMALLFLALTGIHPRLATIDHLVVLGVLLLWLRYGWRVVELTRAYPRLAAGVPTPNPRARWHWPKGG